MDCCGQAGIEGMLRRMRRLLFACCLVFGVWGCAKDEPPPPAPQVPHAAPAEAESSDEAREPESKAAEEPGAPPAPATDLPRSTGDTPPKTQGGLAQEKPKEDPGFSDVESAEKAFKAADQQLTQLLGASATALSDGDARCDRACQAFASLERAADGICRLAGESDQRCSRARSRVKDHAGRLKACECK